jgi:Protein of unknown function (DUF2795)
MPETDLRDVLAALEDADLPAEEDELVQAAEAADEPEPVVAALRAFPPVEYANRDEVARSVPVRPASDREYTPVQRAQSWASTPPITTGIARTDPGTCGHQTTVRSLRL